MLQRLNSMQIRERLVKAFVLIAGLLAVVAAVGLVTMIAISNFYADALTNYGFAQGDVGQAMASFADARSALRGVIGYEELSAIDSMQEEHKKYKENFLNEFHQFTTFLKIKIQTHVLYCIIKASNQNHTKRDEFVSTAYYT